MSYTPYVSTQVEAQQRTILTQVYAWMTAGLFVTGAVASFVANTPALIAVIFGNPILFFGLLIAEVAMVWTLSASIRRLDPAVATAMFALVRPAIARPTTSIQSSGAKAMNR